MGSMARVMRMTRSLAEFPRLPWDFMRAQRAHKRGVHSATQISATQASAALSSSDADYVSLIRAASKGLQALPCDLGRELFVVLRSAAGRGRGLAHRVRDPMRQEALKSALPSASCENLADLLTKPRSAAGFAVPFWHVGAALPRRTEGGWAVRVE